MSTMQLASKHDGGARLDSNPSNTAICTYTGVGFDLLDVDTWIFDIEDIARSLSNLARFNGHTHFYSVAEHSVRVASELLSYGPQVQLLGLLHDATEAYLGDVPRPQKGLMTIDGEPFSEFEESMGYMIFQAFDVLSRDHAAEWALVKQADYDVYLLERDERPSPRMMSSKGMTPPLAYEWFITRFDQYCREMNPE